MRVKVKGEIDIYDGSSGGCVVKCRYQIVWLIRSGDLNSTAFLQV